MKHITPIDAKASSLADPGRAAQGMRLPLADQYFLNFMDFGGREVGFAYLFRGWHQSEYPIQPLALFFPVSLAPLIERAAFSHELDLW